jgi:uncharacterized protein YcfJ
MHQHAETTAAAPQRSPHRPHAQARAPVPARTTPAAPARDRDDADGAVGATVGGIIGGVIGIAAGALLGGVAGAIVGGVLGGLLGAGAGYLIGRRTVTINVTRLSGVADTTSVDVERANQVYKQADVHVTTGSEVTLPPAVSAAILGADNALDNFTGNTLTAEETKLVSHNRTPGRITAYYVPRFRSGGLRGEAIRPSRFGVADPSVVVGANTRVLDTLAHELGHVLTNDGSHPNVASNLMASGGIRNFTDNLTPTQISQIQSSPYVR